MAEDIVRKVTIDAKGALSALRKVDKGSDKVAKSLGGLGETVEGIGKKFGASEESTSGLGKKLGELGKKYAAVAAAVVVLTKVLKDSLMAFAEYENTLLKIQALTGATDEAMKGLSDTIRGVAKASIFTASEVGLASQALSKMGVDADEQMTVLANVTAVATGTQEDLVAVTELSAKIMNMYNLRVGEMARITDVWYAVCWC